MNLLIWPPDPGLLCHAVLAMKEPPGATRQDKIANFLVLINITWTNKYWVIDGLKLEFLMVEAKQVSTCWDDVAQRQSSLQTN